MCFSYGIPRRCIDKPLLRKRFIYLWYKCAVVQFRDGNYKSIHLKQKGRNKIWNFILLYWTKYGICFSINSLEFIGIEVVRNGLKSEICRKSGIPTSSIGGGRFFHVIWDLVWPVIEIWMCNSEEGRYNVWYSYQVITRSSVCGFYFVNPGQCQ